MSAGRLQHGASAWAWLAHRWRTRAERSEAFELMSLEH